MRQRAPHTQRPTPYTYIETRTTTPDAKGNQSLPEKHRNLYLYPVFPFAFHLSNSTDAARRAKRATCPAAAADSRLNRTGRAIFERSKTLGQRSRSGRARRAAWDGMGLDLLVGLSMNRANRSASFLRVWFVFVCWVVSKSAGGHRFLRHPVRALLQPGPKSGRHRHTRIDRIKSIAIE